MRIKNILFYVALFCVLQPLKAQIINQFKCETGNYAYLQFPTQKERKSSVTIQLIEENALGNVANNVVKNQVIASALTQNNGVLGNDTKELVMNLIPDVFITDGDLFAEVNYSMEFKGKSTMSLPEETYNTVDGGEKIQALVSFKIYTMPDKKIIYTQDKMWVNGMMAKSSSSSPVSTTSGTAIASATKRMVEGWAKDKIDMLYGMGIRHKTLSAYLIKKQEKEDEKIAQDIQSKLLSCIGTLRKDRGTAQFNAVLDECIAHYNKMLNKHKKGTTKQDEAIVTDNNVWCLYYNLAVAYLLKEDEKNALANIEKAASYRFIKTKEITNKSGEKIGEASGMIPSGYYEISSLKNLITSYFNGVKTMPKEFIAFLNSEEKLRNASLIAREWGANSIISSMMQFETPVCFIPEVVNNTPKALSGSVSSDNKSATFSLKASLVIPKFGYTLKVASADKNRQIKVKYGESFRPAGALYRNTYALYLGDDKSVSLPSGAFYKGGKVVDQKCKIEVGAANAKGNKHPFCGSKFQYDYNGDIIITNVVVKENGLFYSMVLNNTDEYLGVATTIIRIKHKDYNEVLSLNVENTTIERSRSMKLFEAFTQKKVSAESLIPADEISKSTKSIKVDVNKKVVSNDVQGNCVNEKIANSVVERNYVY